MQVIRMSTDVTGPNNYVRNSMEHLICWEADSCWAIEYLFNIPTKCKWCIKYVFY